MGTRYHDLSPQADSNASKTAKLAALTCFFLLDRKSVV